MNKEISALSTENKLSHQWRDNYKKNSAGKDLMRKVSFEDKELDETVVVRKFRTTTQHGAIEGKTQSHDVAHIL